MKRNKKNEEINSWISIGDLMSGVLAIFITFFIVLLISIQKERKEYFKLIENLDLTKYEIIENLKKNKELKLNIDDSTGTITLDSEILFESDDYELKEEGKKFLKQFIPKYIEVLVGDEKIVSNIEEIIIEGHTDKQGSYIYNLNLSQKRALSVVEYINSEEIGNFKGKEKMQKYLTANGRSYIDFLGDEKTLVDPKSRRVEFKFILKEGKTLDILREIFKEKGGM